VSSAQYGTKNGGSLLTSNDIKLKAGEVSVLSKVYPLGGSSYGKTRGNSDAET